MQWPGWLGGRATTGDQVPVPEPLRQGARPVPGPKGISGLMADRSGNRNTLIDAQVIEPWRQRAAVSVGWQASARVGTRAIRKLGAWGVREPGKIR